ncbi:MAG: hypothetical protein LBD90_09060 [Bifidobacteriaceae bacterium]|nr:hypothetical protein [Bifidobacteriaceae bacterium]
MIFCVPVEADGRVGHGWGRARAVAVASLGEDGRIAEWAVHQVGWDELHGAEAHGSHHARIVRFLRAHRVGCVVAEHMGPGMTRVMESMRIATFLGAAGSARACVEQAAAILAGRSGPAPSTSRSPPTPTPPRVHGHATSNACCAVANGESSVPGPASSPDADT